MKGFHHILIVLISTVVTGAVALPVAAMTMEWSNVSNFEGARGYAVVALALGGIVLGFVTGAAASAMAFKSGAHGFFKTLAYALGPSLAIIGVLAALSWSGKDGAPEFDGSLLDVEIELRLPAGAAKLTHNEGHSDPSITLYGRGMKNSSTGQLRIEDARDEGGQWIIPAIVELSSRHSGRLLVPYIGDKQTGTVWLPDAGLPATRHFQWSDWIRIPNTEAEAQAGAKENEFRFRLQKRPVVKMEAWD